MGTHLTLGDRTTIQQGLLSSQSLRQIASELGRALSVVSREVKRHRNVLDKSAYGRVPNRCIHRNDCQRYAVCLDKPDCTRRCAICRHCNIKCPDYVELHCPRLNNPPYACNGCQDKPSCVLRKLVYDAKTAQNTYETLLSSSRSGLNMTEEELSALDLFVSPLLRKGQSIHHIVMTQRDALIRSPRTLYRLVHASALSARPIDMPRVCRLKPRKAPPNPLKVDKACRTGRSFADYHTFISEHPDLPVVQMDSVTGRIGGKVLLTMHLMSFDFMLAILRDQNTARSVTTSLSLLREKLSPSLFTKLFPILLTDNGSEFSDPSAIEFLDDTNLASRVFFCDPLAAYQKPNVELSHEFIRRFFPKGSSFDSLMQGDVSLMMSHINSYARAKFGGLSPSQLLIQAYGVDTLRLLGQDLILPENIVLNASIFRK